MNVALICHVYPPEHAPGGVMIAELAEDLAARGHCVSVLTGWPNHPEGILYPGWRKKWRSVERDAKGFRVIRCGHSVHPHGGIFWRLWYYLTFSISTLLNGWRAGSFEVIFSLSTPVFGCWSAWLLARMKRARFVYGIFDLHPESAANARLIQRGLMYRWLRKADSLLCRRSDAIVTLGEGLKSEIAARGIAGEKIAVVPFWLDGRKLRPGPRENAWRREQGIDTESFVALYAGTIGFVSGAEVLIETARLLGARKDILILCVGEGPIKNRLAAAALQNGLKNVRFLPFQPAAILNQVQATADVGLVTLRSETSQTSVPSKVLGYMAAGRPVIASVGLESDTAALIRQAGCGRVTVSQDPIALARAIEELADDPLLRLELGKRGRLYFEKNLDREICVREYERLLTAMGSCRERISRKPTGVGCM